MTFAEAITKLEDPDVPRDEILPAIVAALKALDKRAKARAAKATQLPDDWAPTDAHRARALLEGLDVTRETEKFRAHAEATGRKMKSWDAAFTTWLMNARDFNPNKPAADSRASEHTAESEAWALKRDRVKAFEAAELKRLAVKSDAPAVRYSPLPEGVCETDAPPTSQKRR